MSTYSNQSDIHRDLSRERKAEVRHYSIQARRQTAADNSDFDHLGAHFARRDSFPNYPDGVEFSEDDVAQPGRLVPGALTSYQAQHARIGEPSHGSKSRPTRDFSRDHFCILPEGFDEIQRQRDATARRKRCSTHSQQSRGSTPTQGYQQSTSTFSVRSEYNRYGSSAPPSAYTFRPAQSAAFSESHTPSQCSMVTDEDETYEEGAGPSPPHPFSSWDLYNREHLAGMMDTDGNARALSGSREISGTSGSLPFSSSTH